MSGNMEVRHFRSMHELTQNIDRISNVRLSASVIDELVDQLLIGPLINRLCIYNIY